jgi:hypothetical protein
LLWPVGFDEFRGDSGRKADATVPMCEQQIGQMSF